MEVEKLKNRVDQQCSLIAMLKQRSDRAHEQASKLMERYDTANKQVEELQDQLSREILQRKIIEQRFQDLSCNFDEMVKIKDDYKRSAHTASSANIEELTCLELDLQQMKKLYDESQRTIDQLRKENTVLVQKCNYLETLMDNHQSEKRINDQKCSQLEAQLEQQKSRLTESKTECEQLTSELQKVESTIEKRAYDMMLVAIEKHQQQVSHKHKLLSEKERQLMEQTLIVSKMEVDLREKICAVQRSTCNSVTKLKEELLLTQSKIVSLEQEYAAYKTHTTQLLQNERDLNIQLRHMLD